MRSNRKRMLLQQNNFVKVITVNPVIHEVALSLDKAKEYIKQGITIAELKSGIKKRLDHSCVIEKIRLLPDDMIALYKFEEQLNSINPTNPIKCSDGKLHRTSSIIKLNEIILNVDPIGHEIKNLFRSNSNLRDFCY